MASGQHSSVFTALALGLLAMKSSEEKNRVVMLVELRMFAGCCEQVLVKVLFASSDFL